MTDPYLFDLDSKFCDVKYPKYRPVLMESLVDSEVEFTLQVLH